MSKGRKTTAGYIGIGLGHTGGGANGREAPKTASIPPKSAISKPNGSTTASDATPSGNNNH